MKILVFSDSHHCIGNMYDAVELEKPDMAFHLGDCIGDAQDLSSAFPLLDLCYVPGNCDYCSSAPASLLQEVGGVRIFLTHGHLFGIKTGLTRLLLEGKRVGAQLVLFGHTHRPYLEEHDGVWLLNPGSCSAMQGSYAVLSIENGGFHAELKEIG